MMFKESFELEVENIRKHSIKEYADRIYSYLESTITNKDYTIKCSISYKILHSKQTISGITMDRFVESVHSTDLIEDISLSFNLLFDSNTTILLSILSGINGNRLFFIVEGESSSLVDECMSRMISTSDLFQVRENTHEKNMKSLEENMKYLKNMDIIPQKYLDNSTSNEIYEKTDKKPSLSAVIWEKHGYTIQLVLAVVAILGFIVSIIALK